MDDAQKRKRVRQLSLFKLAREPSQRPAAARRCRPSWPLPSTQRSREDASARQCDWVRTHRSAKHAQRQSVVALSSQSVEPQQTWIKALRGERLCSRGLCAPLDAFSRSNFMLKVVCMPTRHRLSTQLAHSTCRSGSTNTCDGRNTAQHSTDTDKATPHHALSTRCASIQSSRDVPLARPERPTNIPLQGTSSHRTPQPHHIVIHTLTATRRQPHEHASFEPPPNAGSDHVGTSSC